MLTNPQIQTLKAAIAADATAATMFADGNLQGLADLFNADHASFVVWRSSLPTEDLFDAIVWANFTPSPAPDGTAAWTNRALACQGKQFNVQTMLVGRSTLNPSNKRTRDGLQDALSDIPSGTNGNVKQGGWANVLPLLHRKATRFEALFATGTGVAADPATGAGPALLGKDKNKALIEGVVPYTMFMGL